MQITVKLFATFRSGRFAVETREYPAGTSVNDIVAELALADRKLGMLLVNSRQVGLERILADGETLALFPLVDGG